MEVEEEISAWIILITLDFVLMRFGQLNFVRDSRRKRMDAEKKEMEERGRRRDKDGDKGGQDRTEGKDGEKAGQTVQRWRSGRRTEVDGKRK